MQVILFQRMNTSFDNQFTPPWSTTPRNHPFFVRASRQIPVVFISSPWALPSSTGFYQHKCALKHSLIFKPRHLVALTPTAEWKYTAKLYDQLWKSPWLSVSYCCWVKRLEHKGQKSTFPIWMHFPVTKQITLKRAQTKGRTFSNFLRPQFNTKPRKCLMLCTPLSVQDSG